MKYYAYTGTLSVIGGPDCRIILHDIQDDGKPPIMLNCSNPALHDYLERRGFTDDEERYIKQVWIFDSILRLVAIVIPSIEGSELHFHRPAKIIADADPSGWSDAIEIFGPETLINTPKPEMMDLEEFYRWADFRSMHNIYGF